MRSGVGSICGRLLFVLACIHPGFSMAVEEGFEEHDIKTVLLSRLPEFIEWPQVEGTADARFDLCMLEDDTPDEALAFFEGLAIRDRAVHAERRDPKSLNDDCDLVFVSADHELEIAAQIDQLLGSGTLVVGETRSFMDRGGILALVLDEGHVVVLANPTAAHQHDFRLESSLLDMARLVEANR